MVSERLVSAAPEDRFRPKKLSWREKLWHILPEDFRREIREIQIEGIQQRMMLENKGQIDLWFIEMPIYISRVTSYFELLNQLKEHSVLDYWEMFTSNNLQVLRDYLWNSEIWKPVTDIQLDERYAISLLSNHLRPLFPQELDNNLNQYLLTLEQISMAFRISNQPWNVSEYQRVLGQWSGYTPENV